MLNDQRLKGKTEILKAVHLQKSSHSNPIRRNPNHQLIGGMTIPENSLSTINHYWLVVSNNIM